MAWQDVLTGSAQYSVEQADCLTWLAGLPADSIDCIISSPPYVDARLYLEAGQNLGVARDCQAWIDWMLEVSIAAQRVCRGPIFWVVAGVTRKRNYQPAPEGLAYLWWKRGGDCQLYRPCVFHRVGIPGSGGEDYLRADWEYILCMKRPGKLPWSDNTACGHPPKWAPGGEMSYRLADGARRNEFGIPGSTKGSCIDRRVTRGHAEGDTASEDAYLPPVLANPGNAPQQTYTAEEVAQLLRQYESDDWLHRKVGGGLMGHPLAHKNEAPFPLSLAEFFVRSFCPPGGVVCDPFVGSGTVCDSALKWGRRFVGCDLRQSQVDLTARRAAEHDGLFTQG